ncbi:MAG: ATP-binding cassette domain-containing protein [Actinobacteria bacterium]|nr:ATP-binding cassette domain-containing protein [Actinomycetota bacterium]
MLKGRRVPAGLVLLPAAAAAVLVAAPTRPPRPPIAGWTALTIGAAIGATLFLALAGRASRGLVLRPGLLVAGVVVAGSEETLWRGFALARLASVSGIGLGLFASTIGFAATHFPAQRWRGVAVQLGTGTIFGTLFAVTGSLAGAVAAHGVYNLLALTTRRPAAAAAVDLGGVGKRYGEHVALEGIDLVVEPGEIVALLGPNGAGKTTLATILLGLRRADGGTVRVLGEAPGSLRVRRLVTSTPQEMSFPPTLRVGEIVDFVLAHYPDPQPRDELLRAFGIADLARRQVGALSAGQRRRLAVALAFGPRPQLTVLDEPTTGLDVESRLDVWDAVRAHAAGSGAVLLTTHHLEEAETLAGRVVVIRHGRIVAEGAPSDLRAPGDATFEEAYLRLSGGRT